MVPPSFLMNLPNSSDFIASMCCCFVVECFLLENHPWRPNQPLAPKMYSINFLLRVQMVPPENSKSEALHWLFPWVLSVHTSNVIAL